MKKHSFNRSNRKLLLLVPVLLGCTLLAANGQPKEDIAQKDNEWVFKGNHFAWRYTDTIAYDREKKQPERAPAGSKTKRQIIYSMNGESVYQNDYLETPATYGLFASSYIDYIKHEFLALRKNTADSLAIVTELSLVVDKYGKVVFYSAKYDRLKPMFAEKQTSLYPYGDPEPTLNAFMDKIIISGPAFKPAMADGKAVNSYVHVYIPGC